MEHKIGMTLKEIGLSVCDELFHLIVSLSHSRLYTRLPIIQCETEKISWTVEKPPAFLRSGELHRDNYVIIINMSGTGSLKMQIKYEGTWFEGIFIAKMWSDLLVYISRFLNMRKWSLTMRALCYVAVFLFIHGDGATQWPLCHPRRHREIPETNGRSGSSTLNRHKHHKDLCSHRLS